MRYFEDFAPGMELPLALYRVTREEIVAFATEFDPQPFHLDEAAAAGTMLGGLAASGWHSCAILMRMMCDGWLLQSASMGAPAVDRAKWLRPIRPGDVLAGHSTVVATKASQSRPDRGFVQLRHRVFNAADEMVLEMENPMMIRRRDAAA